ncbi:MAG: hypothetical protein ABIK30_11985, partial [bacterium]
MIKKFFVVVFCFFLFLEFAYANDPILFSSQYQTSKKSETFSYVVLGVIGGAVIGGIFGLIAVSSECDGIKDSSEMYETEEESAEDCENAGELFGIFVVGGAIGGGIMGYIYAPKNNTKR